MRAGRVSDRRDGEPDVAAARFPQADDSSSFGPTSRRIKPRPTAASRPPQGGGRKMIGRKMGRTVILPRRPATAPLHFSAIHLSATLRPRRSAWCDSDERCVRGAERGHPAKWKRAHLPRIGGRKFIEKAGWPSMPALSSCHVRRLRRRSTRCTLHEFPGPPLQRVGPNRTVTPVTSGRHPAVLKNQ
jgi:hypothetical protein